MNDGFSAEFRIECKPRGLFGNFVLIQCQGFKLRNKWLCKWLIMYWLHISFISCLLKFFNWIPEQDRKIQFIVMSHSWEGAFSLLLASGVVELTSVVIVSLLWSLFMGKCKTASRQKLMEWRSLPWLDYFKQVIHVEFSQPLQVYLLYQFIPLSSFGRIHSEDRVRSIA
jgi:hypothetical protein